MVDRSVWVALFPRPEEAVKLAIPGGFSPDKLHLTLSYLGDNYTKEPGLAKKPLVDTLHRFVRGVTVNGFSIPREGYVAGHGYFYDSRIFFIIPEIPDLTDTRSYLVEWLPPTQDARRFFPHISLAEKMRYMLPKTIPLHFDAITLMHGKSRVDIPWES